MSASVESRLQRLHRDLERALKKPASERSWVMLIDIDKCIGCQACAVACIAENALPPGVTYRTVKEAEDGEYPEVKRYFMPTNCQQCDKPSCVQGLPKDAWTKRPDGIVVFHYDKLQGKDIFEQVSTNCPYSAVYYDDGHFFTEGTPKLEPYELRPSYDYNNQWHRKQGASEPPVGSVRKCHFCLHRLEAGMLPACVTTCVGGAMYFGDKNLPNSLVRELLEKRQTKKINEDAGTQPRVIYLTGTISTIATCAACHG